MGAVAGALGSSSGPSLGMKIANRMARIARATTPPVIRTGQGLRGASPPPALGVWLGGCAWSRFMCELAFGMVWFRTGPVTL